MKRFDQHVHWRALQIEHAVYLRCNNDPLFRQLLSWQLKNMVSSRKGYKYETLGRRMSGDMNTALGNCIIMISMVVGFFLDRRIKFDLLDDGDDCLVIVEETDLAVVQAEMPAHFLSCGHEVQIQGIFRSIPEVSWCQSSPISCAGGWKFVRNPSKVLSTCLTGTKWLGLGRKARLQYLAGLGTCELVLNSGVPVLQEFAKALLRNARGACPRFDRDAGEWFRYVRELRSTTAMESEITLDARFTFAQAFGISLDEQQWLEEDLASWEFDVVGDVEESGRDPNDWGGLFFTSESWRRT